MNPTRLILTGLITTAMPGFAADPTKEQLDFFEQKIRPILANNCYKCHAEETGKSKGGLKLDTAKATLLGGDSGKGIVPGDPEKSLIYKAITYKDPDMEMPPSSSGGKLSDAQIADIAAWIKMGAPDPRTEAVKAGGKLSGLTDKARSHWAYQPVKNYRTIPIPKTKNAAWVRTPVDSFILQKLEEKGMIPSPDADRETLLRRAYYDLIGMPPSPAEVEAFVADPAPNAWEKVIDRLLASPHYGERWGRHWLDTARYADTIGGDANTNNGRNDYRYAHAWTYRDYVIRSFNEDKPYETFVTEQLAADLMYPMKPVGSVAKTAPVKPAAKPAPMKPDPFNLAVKTSATPPTAKGAPAPAKPAAMPADTMAPQSAMMGGDMMMNGGSMMGGGGTGEAGAGVEMEADTRLAALGFLTVGERFNNNNDIINDRIDVVGRGMLGLTVACARCHDHMFDPISQKDYYALHGVFNSISEPTEKPLISAPDPKQREEFEKLKATIEKENRDIYFRESEHWLGLFQSKAVQYFRAALLREDGSEKAQLERQELIKNEQLDPVLANYVGRVLNEGNRFYGPIRKFKEVKRSEFDTHGALVMKEIAASKRYSPAVVQALKDANPQSMEQVIGVYNRLLTQSAPKLNGYVKAYQTATTDKVTGYEDMDFIDGLFAMTPAPKADSTFIRNATGGWPVQFTGRARFVFAKLNQLELTHPGAPARAMVVRDRSNPQDSNVMLRGEPGNRGDRVERRFLEILSPGHKAKPFSKSNSGRLELAKSITSKENPLTYRVLINRVWLHHFGEGFVRTPDDLGVMSEAPTHPELIDFLASWFMENGQSTKKLHKLIMLSRVYQAANNAPPGFEEKYAAIDPENRYLWRANVRRLDFEAIRDSLLTFSGRLDPKLGGQPVNITDEPYIYRRSVYGYIDRGNLSELMGHFDFSDPDMPNSKRSTTIVPQQALFLMNSPMAIDVARRVVARPEVQRADNDFRRVTAIYRILFQRQPKRAEAETGIAFIRAEAARQAEVEAMGTDIAKKTAQITKRIEDRRKRDNDAMKEIQNEGEIVERKVLSPWESYVHALLFANESAYVN